MSTVSTADETIDSRVAALLADLSGRPGVVVAFSGGADSAFLLAAAVQALGPERVMAATAISDSLPEWERGPAAAFAAELGVTHRLVDTHEMEREGYRANAGSRCYFCKAELLDVVSPIADERGWPVATGTNADDAIAGFRPGIRAAAERGAITPLRDAGLTKDQVREQSRRWGLRTWDKPAAACLSSRIAYGIEITPTLLARVERAEGAVRQRWSGPVPLTDLRVRDLGQGRARLEVDAEALAGLEDDPEARRSACEAVRDSGFDEVEVRAFRSGSMNDALRRSAPVS
ncbi:MAG TPA: ExsB family transcriptional regulator [Candidatus Avipropionibacterium avicola]|uniref:ExsB family transcriptional regulator n=1 Tax=Candidatus Avipropionibacterium avicola TaxID=2840701 RepID=A0A9D1H0G1_9ACTN|nr:ExsB family transcriptional regulator [Candidatus Avipropionibacterium avicola]